jgi:hypothetical protein
VTKSGDGDDNDPDVFPGQTKYFSQGYSRQSTISFDYDCSGAEEQQSAGFVKATNCTVVDQQYSKGVTVLEVGGRGGAVLDGRFNTGDDARRKLGGFDFGAYMAVHLADARFDVSWMRVVAKRSDPKTPVDMLRGAACVYVDIFGACVDAWYMRGDVQYRMPIQTSTSQVLYGGLLVGLREGLPEGLLHEAVDRRGLRDRDPLAGRLRDDAVFEQALEAAAEVAWVLAYSAHDLVDVAELRDRERRGHEVAEDARRLEVLRDARASGRDDFEVIEREVARSERVDREPLGVARVTAGAHERREVGPHERVVRDGDDAHARITTGFPERAELLEVDVAGREPCLFGELARGGGVEVLALIAVAVAHAHEAAGQRPRAFEGIRRAAHEQHAELRVDHAEDGEIDRDRWAREIGGLVVAEKRPLFRAGPARSGGRHDELDRICL